jgi:Mg2+ and Co2+ transporter CorA
MSMDMFAATAENLVNFIFNVRHSFFSSLPCANEINDQTNSNSMNESMARFTFVTIVCLPMTLLTGYFVRTTMPSRRFLLLTISLL